MVGRRGGRSGRPRLSRAPAPELWDILPTLTGKVSALPLKRESPLPLVSLVVHHDGNSSVKKSKRQAHPLRRAAPDGHDDAHGEGQRCGPTKAPGPVPGRVGWRRSIRLARRGAQSVQDRPGSRLSWAAPLRRTIMGGPGDKRPRRDRPRYPMEQRKRRPTDDHARVAALQVPQRLSAVAHFPPGGVMLEGFGPPIPRRSGGRARRALRGVVCGSGSRGSGR